MQEAELYDSQWLLAYEGMVKGWLPPVGGTDYIATEESFRFLREKGVSFYQPEPPLAAIRRGQAPPPRKIIQPPTYY